MKKIIKLGFVFSLILMLAGCQSKESDSKSSANTDSTTTTGAGTTEAAGTSISNAKGTEENPIILGVSPMSGWYAWYGVEGAGLFEKNGVYVKIEFFPVYSDSLTAFYSEKVDAICIAASDTIAPLNEGIDFKVVLVNDNSYGADGIVTSSDIASMEELKGKTVATELGTLEHMFLLKILESNGMTIDDINFVNMTINDAGPAFIAGSVDAAVLWEPTLSMAIEAGGNLLYSSKETPGLIPDTLAVHTEVIESSSENIQKMVNAWFEGVDLLEARDEAFIQAILEGAELTEEEYMTMLDGVTMFTREDNVETFKEGEDYSSLIFTLKETAEFLLEVDMIRELPEDVTVILDDSYIK